MTKIHFDVNDAGLRRSLLGETMAEALQALGPDEPARWGRMTAQQMVEHLLWAVEMSTGRMEIRCPVPEEQQARMRKFLYKNMPMPREFENPLLVGGLPALRYPGLPQAAAALADEARRFLESAEAAPPPRVHPVFGAIGHEEWSRAHFKHACHHLMQFGLLEVEMEPR